METVYMAYNSGDVAWLLTSTALVFMMTLGLAFFYASLVRESHMGETINNTIMCMGLVTVQWILFGYSLAFGFGTSGFIGNFMFVGLNGMAEPEGPSDTKAYGSNVPPLAFVVFQMSFAVLTASLITGALIGRTTFKAFALFIFLWTTLVYDPICHWVWGLDGWLRTMGSLDFAGGSVVHVSAGFSALAASIVAGKRHRGDRVGVTADLRLNLLGSAMLWVGWFGFNGGSAVSAGSLASLAFINTQICACTSMFVWAVLDMARMGTVSVDSPLYAAVVGLVVITPCCGFVAPAYALVMGICGSALSYAVLFLWIRYAHLQLVDDSVHVFCSHGIGGVMGSLSAGLFASESVNPAGANGAVYGNPTQLAIQLADVCATAGWAFVVTLLIALLVKHTVGLGADHVHGHADGQGGDQSPAEHSLVDAVVVAVAQGPASDVDGSGKNGPESCLSAGSLVSS